MKYILSIIFLLYTLPCLAQRGVKPEDLFGRWKVRDYEVFSRFPPDYIDEYKHKKAKCLKSLVSISSKGISISGSNCDFGTCTNDFYTNPVFIQVSVIDDSKLPKPEDIRLGDFYEDISNRIVSRKFVQMIDKNYMQDTITCIETGCLTGYPDYSLKICVLSRTKIALYTDYEIIVLERAK